MKVLLPAGEWAVCHHPSSMMSAQQGTLTPSNIMAIGGSKNSEKQKNFIPAIKWVFWGFFTSFVEGLNFQNNFVLNVTFIGIKYIKLDVSRSLDSICFQK